MLHHVKQKSQLRTNVSFLIEKFRIASHVNHLEQDKQHVLAAIVLLQKVEAGAAGKLVQSDSIGIACGANDDKLAALYGGLASRFGSVVFWFTLQNVHVLRFGTLDPLLNLQWTGGAETAEAFFFRVFLGLGALVRRRLSCNHGGSDFHGVLIVARCDFVRPVCIVGKM